MKCAEVQNLSNRMVYFICKFCYWKYTVVDAKKVTKYRCPLCGNGSDNEYSSLDAYYKHFDAKHGDDSLSSTFRDSYEEVERWEEYETKEWIVDSEAYDETVITGYKCSVCGAKK